MYMYNCPSTATIKSATAPESLTKCVVVVIVIIAAAAAA